MKHILITLSLFCLKAMAQDIDYRPFSEEGKVWTNDYFQLVSGTWYHNLTKLDGDTIIGEKTCLKAYVNGNYRGAFFDEGYRTFYISPESTEPRLVYDFSLKVGDKVTATILTTYTEENLTVTAVGVVKCGENNLKCMTLKNGKAQYEWVEGVGHKYGPLPWIYFDFPGGAPSSRKQIKLCAVKGKFLYWLDDFYDNRSSFVAEDKHWLVSNSLNGETEHYLMQGDTIIAGQKAKRMFCNDIYLGGFFDEGGYIHFIPKDCETAYPYYNFSIGSTGDCRTVWRDGKYVRLYINNARMMSGLSTDIYKYHFINIEGEDLCTKDTFYDGIYKPYGEWCKQLGALSGPMDYWRNPTEKQERTLLACWTPDGILYDANGISAIRGINTPDNSYQTVFDLNGNRLNHPAPHGIAIENGRKILRKN